MNRRTALETIAKAAAATFAFNGLIWVPKAKAVPPMKDPSVLGSLNKPMAVAAGGCTTDSDTAQFDYTAAAITTYDASIGGADYGSPFHAIQFTCSGLTATQYLMNVGVVTASGNITASLNTNNAGAVGTLIADTSVTVAVSATGVSTFTLSTPKTGLTGTLWLKFEGASAGVYISTKTVISGYTHRVALNGEYYDNGASKTALFGCT